MIDDELYINEIVETLVFLIDSSGFKSVEVVNIESRVRVFLERYDINNSLKLGMILADEASQSLVSDIYRSFIFDQESKSDIKVSHTSLENCKSKISDLFSKMIKD